MVRRAVEAEVLVVSCRVRWTRTLFVRMFWKLGRRLTDVERAPIFFLWGWLVYGY